MHPSSLDFSNLPPILAEGSTRVDLPLLQKLYVIDEYLCSRFPQTAGLGDVGLILSRPLREDGAWCKPTNALEFAATGGESDHYCLLIRDGLIDESSPVVMMWPTAPDEDRTTIVGESLYDFRCFGIHTGYFFILGDADDERPDDTSGLWFVPSVSEENRNILRLMAQELGLKPWPVETYDERFHLLQSRFLHLFDVPEE